MLSSANKSDISFIIKMVNIEFYYSQMTYALFLSERLHLIIICQLQHVHTVQVIEISCFNN